MRRADREVTDVDGMIDIIDHCKVCHIAMMDGKWPYIVAMNFAYSYENGQLVIYLHSAKEGKKLDLLRKDDHVCFEMDYDHEMIPAKYACAYMDASDRQWHCKDKPLHTYRTLYISYGQ